MTDSGPRWCVDEDMLTKDVSLSSLLAMPRDQMLAVMRTAIATPSGDRTAPIDRNHEVWAAGVTYLRSRQERESESIVADVYAKVYEAERPEIFYKSLGWRVKRHESEIRIRRDSNWNVPEPELTLIINSRREIVGYLAGNDVSSRAIEGENPLYLPQAKTYDGSCAIGPTILLTTEADLANTKIELKIERAGATVYEDATDISQMKRSLGELVEFLFRETSFPNGVFLMTGTGIVPPHPFTLAVGDTVTIKVGESTLINTVAS